MSNERLNLEFQKPMAVDANLSLFDSGFLELETTRGEGAKNLDPEQLVVFPNLSAYSVDHFGLRLFFKKSQDADDNNAISPSFRTLSDFVQGAGLADFPGLAVLADTQWGANEGLMNIVPTSYWAVFAKANVDIFAGLLKAGDIDLIQRQAINNQFAASDVSLSGAIVFLLTDNVDLIQRQAINNQFAASGIQTSDFGLFLADNVDTKGVQFNGLSETYLRTIVSQLARDDFNFSDMALQYAVLARIDTAVDGTFTLTDTLTFYFNKFYPLKVNNSTLVDSNTVEHDKNFPVKITKVVYQGKRNLSDELFEISFDRAPEEQVIVTIKIDGTVVDEVQILSVEDLKYVQQNYQKIMSALQESFSLIDSANQTVFWEIYQLMGAF
jgi:hypothetical protein